jgi:hypothetical protein
MLLCSDSDPIQMEFNFKLMGSFVSSCPNRVGLVGLLKLKLYGNKIPEVQ